MQIENGILKKYTEQPGVTEVVIPDSVIGIGEWAFYGCSSLVRITIPSSVTDIRGNVFCGCDSLTAISVNDKNSVYTSVDGVLFSKDRTELIRYPEGRKGRYAIPNSVTCIGNYAFSGCDGLTDITIPDSVTSIGKNAFFRCENLKSVRLPNKLKELSDYLFYACISLETLDLPDSLRKIKMFALYGCKALKHISFPPKLRTICSSAFIECESLKEVVLPAGTKICRYSFEEHTSVIILESDAPAANDTIEKKAFAGSDITSVSIPEGVKRIQEQAFKDCKLLETVVLPTSLTRIAASAFAGCSKLSDVTFGGNSPVKIEHNAFAGTLFEKHSKQDVLSVSSPHILSSEDMVCIGTTLFFCKVNAEDLIVPDEIEGIAADAFRKCTQLRRIYLSKTVKQISKEAFAPEGERSLNPDLEIYAAAGSAAEKHAQKELAFFVPVPAEETVDGHIFEEYKLAEDMDYKKQYFNHIFEKALSDATYNARYKVYYEYPHAISNDGDDIFIGEKEVNRLFSDPDFISLFPENEQKLLSGRVGFSVKKDRIIAAEVNALFLVRLLAALAVFAEAPVRANIGLNKDKWEYRGDYGSSSKLHVCLSAKKDRVRIYLEQQTPWDM